MRAMAAWASGMTDNLSGMAWMALTTVIFSVFTAVVRYVSSDIHPAETAFLRYAFGLAFTLPILFWQKDIVRLPTRRLRGHVTRGVVHAVGVLLWFYAMSRIPLAEVTALGFTAPVFATVGAIVFLGEKIRIRRIMAVVIGFVGAIIVLKPGFSIIDTGAVAMVIAAPLFAISKLLAKSLTRTEPIAVIVSYLSVIVTVVLAIPAILVWRTPTLVEFGWLFLTAGLATLGHLCMTKAFRQADLTVTQPVEFLQLLWATLLGYYLFAESPDIWTWMGGIVIIGSATYIAHREAVARQIPQ